MSSRWFRHRSVVRSTFRPLRLVVERLEDRRLLALDTFEHGWGAESGLVYEAAAEGEGALPELDVNSLSGLSVSTGTGYKPQSKVWQHDGTWWAAVGGGGTKIWRLDGTKWTSVLTLSSTAYRTDVKSDGDLVHVLLFPDGPATKLVTAEYVPAQKTYKLWSQRPQIVDIPLRNNVRIATLDLDSTGRMWVAADTSNTVDVYYSDPENSYSTWNGPVTVGTGVQDGDISVVTTLHNGSIGVFWSNQSSDRFYFREHKDRNSQGGRNSPTDWMPVETAAGSAALNVGGGMADDHLNVAVSADGTLYAGVKTSYDRSGYTEIGVLVRRPSGLWDPKLYHVSYSGTRPIILLNDVLGHLLVIYDNKYHESLTNPISFTAARTLPLGSNATSTKQNWLSEVVVLGGSDAVMISTDAVVNSPPIANSDSYSIDEDQTLTVSSANGILKNDSDPDNDPLAAVLVSSPEHGALSLNSNGSFTYAPSSNYFGPDQFTYHALDGTSTSNLATASITVRPRNDPPLAQDDRYSVEENQTLTVNAATGVLANDTDLDGDPLTAMVVQDVAHGTLTFNASNGSLIYQPESGFSGTDTFTYQAFDGTVKSAVAAVSLIVNARPVARDDSYQVDEDQLLSVATPGLLENDSDADGDPLSVVLVSGPDHGTLTETADGSFTYRPDPDFFGSDSFTYAASDRWNASQPVTVTIDVRPVADPPVAEDDSFSVETNKSLVVFPLTGVLSNDLDADGDALQAKLVTPPARGTLLQFNSDGSFTYLPNPGFEGDDKFTYQAQDGVSSSSLAEVTITVVNSSVPVTVSFQDGLDGYSGTVDTRMREDQPSTNYGTNTKLELDGSPNQVSLIRWDISSIPAGSTVVAASITYNVVTTSLQDFEVYEALRAWNESTATYNQAATGKPWEQPGAAGATDHAPEILGALTGPAFQLTTIDLNAQGVAVIQKWVSDPSKNLGFVIQDLDNASTDDLDISSREQTGLGPKLTITYRTTLPPSPNSPPSSIADSYETDEDKPLVVSASSGVLGNDADPDGDPLQAILVRGSDAGRVSLNTDGSFTYTPNKDSSGVDQFIYRAVDDDGLVSAETIVSLTIHSVNDQPTADDKSIATLADTAIEFLLSGSDLDGDPLTYLLDALPSSGTLSGTTPQLTYTPNPGFFGEDSFTFHAHDGALDSELATVSISVAAVNRAPTADDQTVMTDEDESKSITLTGSDPNGDSLSFRLAAGPGHGTLTGSAPLLTYRPDGDYHGADSFTFLVNDGQLDSSLATVSISVTPVNDQPAVENAAITTSQDTPVGITLAGSDVDGDLLSYNVIRAPSHGTLTGSGPHLIYVPNSGYVGNDAFDFQADDGSSRSNVGTISLTVTPAREPETWSFQDGVFPTSEYKGTTDTAVREDYATSNYGTRTSLWLDGKPDQASFVRWDLTAIPPGSTVQSASISFHVVTTSVDHFELYELLVPWSEREATYVLSRSGVPWQVAGAQGPADRGSTVLGVTTGPTLGEFNVMLNAAGIATVQEWIDDPASNHGFVIQNYNDTNTDDLDIASREAKTVATRPKLTISATPAPVVAAHPIAFKSLQNPTNRFDVDNSGSVSPLDVLVLFNVLNRQPDGEPSRIPTSPFPDVSGDGVVTPRDALLVINYLNRSPDKVDGGEQGELDTGLSSITFAIPDDEKDDPWAWELEDIMALLCTLCPANGPTRT